MFAFDCRVVEKMSQAPVGSPSGEGWSRRHKVSCAGRLGKGEIGEPVPFLPFTVRFDGIDGVADRWTSLGTGTRSVPPSHT
ncbi:uncharacterized protein TNCV_237331 [Trichonephila clavipes]|nr:uncharacterized protein TNCV_237331 [Trichonephila clavipes]